VAPTSCFVPGTRARRRVAEDGLCGPAQRDSPSAPCLWQFLTTNPQPTARPGWPLCLAVSFASTVADGDEAYPATFLLYRPLTVSSFSKLEKIALLYSWKYVGRKSVA
jgi:hypothetical protein